MELTAGGTLGRYRLLERAGAGGMAEVWRAVQPSLDRVVAIKVLPRHLASDHGYIERFRREARAVSRLDHPNILGIHDFGEDDGYTYMVMPFLAGGTLSRNLGQPWSVQAAVRILEPLAAALDYAHAHGIVHRDVKPSNVLIGEGGRVVLADFGVARMTEGTLMLSAAGALVGTPAYMSPEQVQGTAASPASDLYSLAVMAYEMMTGRRPFEAETPLAVALAHVHRSLPPPRSLNPSIAPEVERVLFKALAKQPEDRFPTVSSFVAALAEADRVARQAPPPVGNETWRLHGSAPPRTPMPAGPAYGPGGPVPGGAPYRPGGAGPGGAAYGPSPGTPGYGPSRPGPGAPPYGPAGPGFAGPSPGPPRPAPTTTGSGWGPRRTVLVGSVLALAVILGVGFLVRSPSSGSETATSTPTSVVTTSTPSQAAKPSTPSAAQSSPVAAQGSPPAAQSSPAAAQSSPVASKPSSNTAAQKPAAPPTPNPVVLSDNFESAARGAFQPNYSLPNAGEGSYADGEFRVRRTSTGGGYAIPVPHTPELDNASMAIDAHLVGAPQSRLVYLSCRRKSSEPNTGYRFELDPVGGQFKVARWDGTNETPLAPWKPSDAIKRNNETNRLELTCAGTTIEAAVNGRSLAKVEDGTYGQGNFNFGVMLVEGDPPAEARFDNLAVTRR